MKDVGGSSRAQFLKVWPLDFVHQNQRVEAREWVFKLRIPKLHSRHIESAFLTDTRTHISIINPYAVVL